MEDHQERAIPKVQLPPVLAVMVRDGRLLHSINIEGEAGLGRKTLAVNLAAAALCQEGPQGPCGGVSGLPEGLCGGTPRRDASGPGGDPGHL